MSVDDQITTDLTFGIVPTWVLTADITATAVRLYGVLALRANNDTGQSFPSRAALARACHCHRNTVDNAKAELVAIGALTVEERRRDDGGNASSLFTVRRIPPTVTTTAHPVTTDCDGAVTTHCDAELDLLELDQEPTDAKRPRARFLEYDALVAVFGEPGTKDEAGFYAKVARGLQRDGKPPDQIEVVAREARRRWPSCTVAVVSGRWSTLLPRPTAPGSTWEDVAARDRQAGK